jgi:hypothetical protein
MFCFVSDLPQGVSIQGFMRQCFFRGVLNSVYALEKERSQCKGEWVGASTKQEGEQVWWLADRLSNGWEMEE